MKKIKLFRNIKNKCEDLWIKWWYDYPKWNGILGPGGDRNRYFRRERIWHTILILYVLILTMFIILK